MVLKSNLNTSLLSERLYDVLLNDSLNFCPKAVGLSKALRILKQSSYSNLRSMKYFKYCYNFWKWWVCKNDKEAFKLAVGMDLSIFKSCIGF